jgi:hypothetical protein
MRKRARMVSGLVLCCLLAGINYAADLEDMFGIQKPNQTTGSVKKVSPAAKVLAPEETKLSKEEAQRLLWAGPKTLDFSKYPARDPDFYKHVAAMKKLGLNEKNFRQGIRLVVDNKRLTIQNVNGNYTVSSLCSPTSFIYQYREEGLLGAVLTHSSPVHYNSSCPPQFPVVTRNFYMSNPNEPVGTFGGGVVDINSQELYQFNSEGLVRFWKPIWNCQQVAGAAKGVQSCGKHFRSLLE